MGGRPRGRRRRRGGVVAASSRLVAGAWSQSGLAPGLRSLSCARTPVESFEKLAVGALFLLLFLVLSFLRVGLEFAGRGAAALKACWAQGLGTGLGGHSRHSGLAVVEESIQQSG